MRFPGMNLGLKFSVAVAALIVSAMLVISVLILHFQSESLRQNISENNLAMTANLARDAVEPLLIFDPLRLDELVRTMCGAASCKSAMIADRDGKIVADTDRRFLSRTAPADAQETSTRVRDHSVRTYSKNGQLIREFSVPILIGNEVLGTAVASFSVRDSEKIIATRMKSLKRYIFMITGLILIAGVAGSFAVSSLLTNPLKKLKDKMLSVQSGNLDAEVENTRVVRCWERLDCSKKDCPAYGKLRCWAVAGTFCHEKVQGQFAQKIGDCRKCIVYRESCGDEINELIEVFNQMVKDLRFNLGQLEKMDAEKAKMERLSAIGEMAATVAHETKNPLNSIRIAASYLKKNFQGEILNEFLSIIEEEVTRLNEITSTLLGFSKPAPLHMKVQNINSIVKSAVELIRQEATERNIEVVLLTNERIPPVVCDSSRIKQGLLNLLVNSMEACREGDTITITTEIENSRIVILVRDTGKGMSSEQVGNIFKPFYTTKTRGSGLGLAIVDRIVKEHKGEIEVESSPGNGTVFTIRIPLEVQEYALA